MTPISLEIEFQWQSTTPWTCLLNTFFFRPIKYMFAVVWEKKKEKNKESQCTLYTYKGYIKFHEETESFSLSFLLYWCLHIPIHACIHTPHTHMFIIDSTYSMIIFYSFASVLTSSARRESPWQMSKALTLLLFLIPN